MISAAQFLSVLEEKDLLPKDLLFDLYKRVAQAGGPMTAADIAKIVIDQGYLTPALADRLMGTRAEQLPPSPADSGKKDQKELQKPSQHTEQKKPREPEKHAAKEESSDELEVADEDIGFAPLKEEREPRPMIGKHHPYKPDDSSKNLPATQPKHSTPKPSETPTPKPSLLDKPQPSRWASSVYDREIDTSKGIVSPRLVEMAGMEKIPDMLVSPGRIRWLKVFIRGSIALGLFVILYILISMIFPR
jgi:hypothetical protein